MPEWVRVKDKSTKHEYTVGVVDPEAHEVLKKDAVDPTTGVPVQAKPHMTPTEAKAVTNEESA